MELHRTGRSGSLGTLAISCRCESKCHSLPHLSTVSEMPCLDRQYWGVETGLHLRLDTIAREDCNPVRQPKATMTLGVIRRALVSVAVDWIFSSNMYQSSSAVPLNVYRRLRGHTCSLQRTTALPTRIGLFSCILSKDGDKKATTFTSLPCKLSVAEHYTGARIVWITDQNLLDGSVRPIFQF